MDYTTIDPSQISVDVNNNIVLPTPPAPITSLDGLTASMSNLQETLAEQSESLGIANTLFTDQQNKINDLNIAITGTQTQITALQALIDAANSAGALTATQYQQKLDNQGVITATPTDTTPTVN